MPSPTFSVLLVPLTLVVEVEGVLVAPEPEQFW